jgi:hypothetical protein
MPGTVRTAASEVGKKWEKVVGGAVSREPVSAGNFPDIRNLQGTFTFSPEIERFRPAKAFAYQWVRRQFPYSTKQGTYFAEQGIFKCYQGSFPTIYENQSPTIKLRHDLVCLLPASRQLRPTPTISAWLPSNWSQECCLADTPIIKHGPVGEQVDDPDQCFRIPTV